MSTSMRGAATLSEGAVRVLENNWNGSHTLPATGLYPHQWSWDSAFIAMGLVHVSARRAGQELDSILSGQWDDGRIPQIIFDPWRDQEYAPGSSFWRSELLDDAPTDLRTAGLVQPPNHAWAVLRVHNRNPEESRRRGLLERNYPRLLAWHEYLRSRRDRGSHGLAAVVHPWETGTDNSPLWDDALARVPNTTRSPVLRPDLAHASNAERPTQADYLRYFHLAERYRDHGCDDRDAGYPFLMEDPGFNALLAVSELAMAEIAAEIGQSSEAHHARHQGIVEALSSLYDDELGCFVARDVTTGITVPRATVNGLLPLLVPGLPQRDQLIKTLLGPRFLGSGALLVPSYDCTADDFDPELYWRGPAWFNMNWMLILAATASGMHDVANALSLSARSLAVDNDFPEYVNPSTGSAHGTRRFSWTAALCIDLDRDDRHDLF